MGPWYDYALIWHRDYMPPEPPEGPDPLIGLLRTLAERIAGLWRRTIGAATPAPPATSAGATHASPRR